MNGHGDHNEQRSVRAWLRRWPEWTGIAASGWTLLASVVTIVWASGRRAGYPLSDLAAAGPVAVLSAVVFVTAAVAGWVTRPRQRRRPPRRTLLVVLWAAAALAAAGGFGFVMGAVQLVFSGTVDDWARFAVTIGSAIGAALLIAAAL